MATTLLGYREFLQNFGRLKEAEDANIIPWLHFIVVSLRDGAMPLWNPYVLGGFSMTTPGSWHQGMYYPLVFVRSFVPFGFVDGTQLVLHIFLGGLFVFLLCRRYELTPIGSLTAALTYVLSGYLWFFATDDVEWFIYAAAYVPAVFYFAHRYLVTRRLVELVFCGAVVGLQLMSGQAQLVFYSLVAVGVWTFVSLLRADAPGVAGAIARPVFLVGCAGVLGFLFAAAAYLPYAAGSEETFRTAYYGFSASTFESLRPHELLGAVILPWKIEMFLGSTVVLLAFIALVFSSHPLRVPFVCVALLGLALALGKYAPLHYVLYQLVPAFRVFRSPERALIVYVVGMAMLAGAGMDALSTYVAAERARRRRYWAIVGLVALSLVVIGVVGVVVVLAELTVPALRVIATTITPVREQLEAGTGSGEIAQHLYTALEGTIDPIVNFVREQGGRARRTALPLAAVVAVLLLLLAPRLGTRRLSLVKIVLLGLLVYEGAQINSSFGSRGLRFFDFDRKFDSAKPVVEFLRADRDLHRIATDSGQRGLGINEGMIHRFMDIQGAAANVPLRYHRYLMDLVEEGRITAPWDRASRQVPDFPFYSSAYSYLVQNYDSPFIDLLNVKYVVTSRGLDGEKWQRVFTAPGSHVFRNTRVFPRAWIVPDAEVSRADADLLRTLRMQPDFRKVVFVSDDSGRGVLPTRRAGDARTLDGARVTFGTYEPNTFSLTATTPVDAFLVLSEPYHPAWRAFIDGREAPVWRANYLFRAVPLTAGEHRVVFQFDPPFVLAGRIISAVMWIGLVGLVLTHTVRRRGRQAGAPPP